MLKCASSRFSTMVRQSSPNASVYFNGRALANLREEITYQGQVEIEAVAYSPRG